MVAVPNRPPPAPRITNRASRQAAARAPSIKTVAKNVRTESYEAVLSTMPLWRLANMHLPEARRFSEPPPELSSLHRRVSGNLSRFMCDDIRQILVAHMMMMLCTQISKQEDIFGRDQGVAGGGPYLACSKTIVRPPETLGQHAETHVKGFCQLSKTYETVGEAFHCFFVEGVLPVIFVRNKGGATVGTADMSKGVIEFNSVIKAVFDRVKAYYEHLPAFANVQATDFWLHPRRTSYNETLEFQGNGQYLLRNPQVIIACTNVVQLTPFMNAPAGTVAGGKRALASGQPRLSYIDIFSGTRDAEHSEDANPYLPWVFDVEDIGVPSGGARRLPAIAALFDEDDSNRSSTGNEKKENMLFKSIPGLKEKLNRLQQASAAEETPDGDDEGVANPADHDADPEAALFYQHFRGLRSSFALVVAYTATPTTALYAIGGGASEIDIHMVEITPGKGYIGYRTPHVAAMAPHLLRHVEIVELPNRVASTSFTLKDIYPKLFEELGDFDVERDGVPPPFRRTAAGTITLKQKDFDEDIICPNGNYFMAGEIRQKAMEAVGLTRVRADAFWYADGNNITHLLRDMEQNQAAYPQGYRNVLYMTNFSKDERGKQNLVSTILGFQGDSASLSRGLITIEFDHRYTRLTWLRGHVDESLLSEAVEELKRSEDHIAVEWANACVWGTAEETEEDAEATEVDDDASIEGNAAAPAAHTLQSGVSNINYAYSVLHAYMIKMREKSATSGAPPFFLKMLAFAGEIGARGVRYKSHEHAFVLTDMYHAFNVSVTAQVTAHGAAVIQSIGRLCTLVPDVADTPTIKLWVPANCKDFCELWLDVMDSLPALYAHKQPGETTEQLIERLATMTPPPTEFERVFTHFAAPTGHKRNGEPLYARLDHRIGKAKAFSERLAARTAAAGTAPDPMDFHDNAEEMRTATRDQAVSIAIFRGEEAQAADGEEEGEGLHAVMGPPSVGGIESVPQPTRVRVRRPPASRKRKASAMDDAGYNWGAADRRDASEALQQLRALRTQNPPDAPMPSEEKLMDMFALWYKYFVFAKGACNTEHGLKSRSSRINYASAMQRLTSPVGRSIFTSLACLPRANDQSERHRFRALVVEYFAALYDPVPGGLAENPHKKEIDNTVSWVMKYIEMFPAGDLAYFVRAHPVPTSGASSGGIRVAGGALSHAGAGPSSMHIIELDDDDDDSWGP